MQTQTEKQNAKHCDTWNHEETKGTGTHGMRGGDDTEKHQETQRAPSPNVLVQLYTE